MSLAPYLRRGVHLADLQADKLYLSRVGCVNEPVAGGEARARAIYILGGNY
jgi:hypothetical protein